MVYTNGQKVRVRFLSGAIPNRNGIYKGIICLLNYDGEPYSELVIEVNNRKYYVKDNFEILPDDDLEPAMS